jgi:MYXO-CTERM domain-containing protein
MPIDQIEWEADVYTVEETISEIWDTVDGWETVDEGDVSTDLVEAEPTAAPKSSSGCATGPMDSSGPIALLLVSALILSLAILRRQFHMD